MSLSRFAALQASALVMSCPGAHEVRFYKPALVRARRVARRATVRLERHAFRAVLRDETADGCLLVDVLVLSEHDLAEAQADARLRSLEAERYLSMLTRLRRSGEIDA